MRGIRSSGARIRRVIKDTCPGGPTDLLGHDPAGTYTLALGEDYDRFIAARPAGSPHCHRTRADPGSGRRPSGVWQAPTTTDTDREQLMRHLIEKIRVSVIDDSERVTVRITWADGHHIDGETVRPVGRLDQLSCFPQLTARARELAAAGQNATAIAKILDAEGFRPPKRRDHFGTQGVRQLLRELGCISPQVQSLRRNDAPLGPDEWWPSDLAREIGMPRVTLFGWIKRGRVTAHQQDDRRRSSVSRRSCRSRTAPPPARTAPRTRSPPNLAVPPADDDNPNPRSRVVRGRVTEVGVGVSRFTGAFSPPRRGGCQATGRRRWG